MKLISIKTTLLERYTSVDNEVLPKTKRPAVLVLKLFYRGKNRNFAVPLRSNIPPNVPKDEYFALPNRKTTREKRRHGLHYIKMFPVSKQFYDLYRIDNDDASRMYLDIIDRNEKRIVNECQVYLERYENGERSRYATNIDLLIEQLEALSTK